MLGHVVKHIKAAMQAHADALNRRVVRWTRPATGGLVGGTVMDLPRSKTALVTENALLRQQLIVLNRQVAPPQLTPLDRFLLVVLASRARFWRSALLIVQPDTVLRWHRQGFRLFWKARS